MFLFRAISSSLPPSLGLMTALRSDFSLSLSHPSRTSPSDLFLLRVCVLYAVITFLSLIRARCITRYRDPQQMGIEMIAFFDFPPKKYRPQKSRGFVDGWLSPCMHTHYRFPICHPRNELAWKKKKGSRDFGSISRSRAESLSPFKAAFCHNLSRMHDGAMRRRRRSVRYHIIHAKRDESALT